MADELYQAAEFEQAAEEYRKQTTPDALLGLALCLDQLGRDQEAADVYRRLLASPEADEQQKNAARRNQAYGEGMRHFAAGDFSAARAGFVKALTLQPEDDAFRTDVLRWLAVCDQLADADPALLLVALRDRLEASHAPQPVLERRVLDLRLTVGHARVKPPEKLLV